MDHDLGLELSSKDWRSACVLGGSGFLGSHVADLLSEAGYEVTVFDTEVSPWLRHDQSMLLGDITDPSDVRAAVQECDVVYNFAAVADLNEAMASPVESARINVLGNTVALDESAAGSVQRFVYASSVYSLSRAGGFYQSSKRAAEDFTREFSGARGLDFTILRYGSLYGPRSDLRNGLKKIVSRAVSNGVVQYEGHPEAIREYIHVVDAARASIEILSADYRNRYVSITGMQSIRVVDMLEMLREILQIKEPVDFLEREHHHYIRTPYTYRPDAALKLVPNSHVDFAEGLLDLVTSTEEDFRL